MKFEGTKKLGTKEVDKDATHAETIQTEEETPKELIGAPHKRISSVEAYDIISKTINISELQSGLKSRLFLKEPFVTRETLEALARLILELRERLLQYDTILSDDASGRLPSLLIHKIIKIAKGGKNAPAIYFLAGGSFLPIERRELIKLFLQDKKDKLGRVLLVTEYVTSGDSIRSLMDILEELKITFDTASVHIRSVHANSVADNSIVYGRVSVSAPILYKALGTGVKKRTEDVSSAHPKRHPKRYDSVNIKHKRDARKDLDVIAEELAKLLKQI